MRRDIMEQLLHNASKRAQLLRWLARQPDSIQREACDLALKNYYQLKDAPINQAERLYRGLLYALWNMAGVEHAITRKAIDDDIAKLRKISRIQAERIRAERLRKPSPKRQKLITKYWGLVQQLRREEGLSFREISRFLKKYRRFDINPTYLYAIWKELEEEHDGNSRGRILGTESASTTQTRDIESEKP